MNPSAWRAILIFTSVTATLLRAQTEELPPIFAAKAMPAAALESPPSSLLSTATREHLTEAMFAQVRIVTPQVGKLESASSSEADTVRMDPYIVIPSAPALVLPRPQNAFARFLKTGTIFDRSGPSFDARLRLHIWLLQTPPDPHDNKEFTRYELRFSLRF